MIDHDSQLKLQAFLDGELPEGEARAVANRLAQDKEAAALLGELRHTREALTAGQPALRLPESREFYWSKIQREIQRQDAQAPAPGPATPLLARLRRLLMPATGIALLAIAGLFATGGLTFLRPHVPGIETALDDTGAFTYHDDSAGATLVWLSYPAENEVADDDELSTLD
jgi:anti-sigma factor RsiW